MENRENNLFSTLYRHAYRQGENFTTDAFVYLLRTWLCSESDSESACEFLTWLCFDNPQRTVGDNRFKNPKNIRIDTRRTIGCGLRPDIIIEERDSSVCLIEVKTWSNFHENQLTNYRDCLDDQFKAVTHKRLVSLTVYPYVFKESCAPHTTRYWSEVARRLDSHEIKDYYTSCLAKQFVQFLKDEKMSVDRVEPFMDGIKALTGFMLMLETAIRGLPDAFPRRHGQWDSAGFYFTTTSIKYWAGIDYENPKQLMLDIQSDTNQHKDSLENNGWSKNRWGNYCIILDLDSETTDFFNAQEKSDLQLEKLVNFLQTSCQSANGSFGQTSASTKG